MKIEIEVYKDQTIYYDDNADKFICDISIEDHSKSSKRGSLKDLRREIDVFIKDNMDFKPFKAIRKSRYGGDEFSVVNVESIRTDKKLVITSNGIYKDHVGKKDSIQLMKYDHDIIKELEIIQADFENARQLKNEKIEALNKRLIPLDLSKYDLA